MSDQRIQSTERMVGANHPTLSDTLNRLALVGHNLDGSHKAGVNSIDCSQYASLDAAIAAIGSTVTTLTISTTVNVLSNLTVPSTLDLFILNGGVLTNTTNTIAFNGFFFCSPQQQAFTGSGVISFAQGSVTAVSSQWWGGGVTGMNYAIASGFNRIMITTTEAWSGCATLPTRDLEIIGVGYPSLSSSVTSVFQQTNHGYHTLFQGIKFTGATPGILYNQSTTATAYDEYTVRDCTFAMNAGIYGISLTGSREGRVEDCLFQGSGNGIYTSKANFRFIHKCIFKGNLTANQTAINDDGQNSTYSTGSYLTDCEIMGYVNGVLIDRCEDSEIKGCTIDYNTNNIRITGQQGFKMFGGYAGSAGNNPCLFIGLSTATLSTNIMVQGVEFTGHYSTDNTFDCIQLDTVASANIINNNITFWTRYGVNLLNTCTYVNVSSNQFSALGGHGVNNVYMTTNDSSNRVSYNNFAPSLGITFGTFTNVHSNIGYQTEAAGQAIAGIGVSSYVVAHGLAYTPHLYDVILLPQNNAAALLAPYVSAIDATNLTIGFTGNTVGSTSVVWKISKTHQ